MTLPEGRPKLFGVGLNKTGTKTLGKCGKVLGYRCTNYDRGLLEDYMVRKDLTRIEERVRQFDLFEDWPWPLLYKELDRMCPGSKFILTVRKSDEKWLESLKRHSVSLRLRYHLRRLALGYPFPYGYHFPHKHELHFLDYYRRHNDEVRAYFKDRGDDFIELCWENGDGFEKLCRFLGCEIPDVPFPHENRSARPDTIVGRFRIAFNTLLSQF
jgi:hypothetical protein